MVYRNSKYIAMIVPQIVCPARTPGKCRKPTVSSKLSSLLTNSTNPLPHSFNQLDLPMYKSYDKLRSCLLKAIHECSEGFGFA